MYGRTALAEIWTAAACCRFFLRACSRVALRFSRLMKKWFGAT
jgi:hypothetical protein